MKRVIINFLLLAFAGTFCFASEKLTVTRDDIRLERNSGTGFEDTDGYHLFIRKKDGIESVMLTETTKDPEGKLDNYSYRALEYNPVNGDEIRYLNGKILDSDFAKFSLIDSTPEADEIFGQAFHIYIPAEIAYGYEWTRHGITKIGLGTFINIRAFEKKYCDYTGEFYDNPFMFDLGKIEKKTEEIPVVKEEPPAEAEIPEIPVLDEEEEIEEVVILTDSYNPLAAESFKEISNFNGGKIVYSKGPETIVDDIMDSLGRISPKKNVDVVFALDATGSMIDDVEKLRKEWCPRLLESLSEYENIRMGLILYKDYSDSYNLMGLPVKRFEYTEDIAVFEKNLNSFKIYKSDGGDIPEAVYEALYASISLYEWRSDAFKKIILIGDAEPHPTPRGSGKYSREYVSDLAKKENIVIDAIIVPDNNAKRYALRAIKN